MKHAETPAVIYDLPPLASVVARYNVRHFDPLLQHRLDELLDSVMTLLEQNNRKPLLPHMDPEAVRGTITFITQIRRILVRAISKMSVAQGDRIETFLSRFESRLADLSKQHAKNEWMCRPEEIDRMFGISVASPDSIAILDDEISRWSAAESCPTPHILLSHVPEEEAQRISQLIREQLLGTMECHPDLYVDNPDGYHLFWSPTESGQECAIPETYSLADYLRFHVPHNDAHLIQLKSLADRGMGADAYIDHMDERAFFEAVAVHAEWQMLDRLKTDDAFAKELHDRMDPERARAIPMEVLRQWMIQTRAYEFRLRTARLLADILTVRDHIPFNKVISKSAGILKISKQDATAETRKYYAFTGLGAMYILGYRKLKNERKSDKPPFRSKDGRVVRTWHQFS